MTKILERPEASAIPPARRRGRMPWLTSGSVWLGLPGAEIYVQRKHVKCPKPTAAARV